MGARDTGKNITLLIIESIFGLVVAISNLLMILTFFVGWKKLMKVEIFVLIICEWSIIKSNFYIVLLNLVVCTSLKAFVELAFIVPYYIMQSNADKVRWQIYGTEKNVILSFS